MSQTIYRCPLKKGKLTVEMDELWSFVGSKQQKQWVWLAMDRDPREVVGFACGDRSEQTAQQLWKSEVLAGSLSPMRSVLHRFLGCLWLCLVQHTPLPWG